MKKHSLLIISLLLLGSCSIPNNSENPSTIPSEELPPVSESLSSNEINNEVVHKASFLANYDYGFHIENKVALLFDYGYLNFDYRKYIGNETIIAGDVLEISYTGEIMIQETYPSNAFIVNGELLGATLHKASLVDFTVLDIPGGGLDIVADDRKNYTLPENIVYGDNNFTNINNIYQGLKLKGTLKHDSENNKLIALYAIDYDESKVDNNNNNHYTSDDESLNKYVEEVIKAMTFNIEEDYRYSIYSNNNSFVKHYLKKDNVEYIYHNDETYSDNLNDCLVKLSDNKLIIETTKVRYEDSLTEHGLEYYRTYNNEAEEDFIKFYNENKPLVNNKQYGDYILSIVTIDPCCGGPVYLCFDDVKTENHEDVTIELSTSYVDHNSLFGDKYKNLLTPKQYADKCIQTSSLITFDDKYKLLDKATDASEEDYNFNYGFGCYEFYDKKYESDKNESIVLYEVTNFPDHGFSVGSYITHITITDKDASFNGLTLNSNINDIINKYSALGFNLSDDSENRYVYQKDGIYIIIAKDLSYIHFGASVTNVSNIVY